MMVIISGMRIMAQMPKKVTAPTAMAIVKKASLS
jgi:hypothetical protein